MEVEIVPEPDPREREILLQALGELDGETGDPDAYSSPWRLAALAPAPDDYWDATARRRRRAGAPRA